MMCYDNNGQLREMSYLDMCMRLQHDINDDSSIPQHVKEEATETIANVVDILWKYSD